MNALYELRVLLEQTSIRRIKGLSADGLKKVLAPLDAIWQVPVAKRFKDANKVAGLDEDSTAGS